MRVLMLGWEFPPLISGGLGTACYGLTKALARQHAQITFLLPKAVGQEPGDLDPRVRLLTPAPAASFDNFVDQGADVQVAGAILGENLRMGRPGDEQALAGVRFKAVPSRIVSPYDAGGTAMSALMPAGSILAHGSASLAGQIGALYGGDLIAETQRYARMCVSMAQGLDFDVIHAHDWMTFPAGLALAAATGRPMIAHVHSTEFDRAGSIVNPDICEIEQRGLQNATRVIAVSHLTRQILTHRYGVSLTRIDVVYNGIDNAKAQPVERKVPLRNGDKIVLYLGRITSQKGPEYFVRAAAKVLEKYDRVKFIMAGGGDQAGRIVELAAEAGIGQKLLFTGFLDNADVQRIFAMADLFVMPSVSEPFGIACLEAMRHDVPVIISRTAGVAEVVKHALKVDFWDINDMADKIIAVLRHAPLAATLRHHADLELRRLTWDDAATRVLETYQLAQTPL